MQHASLRASEYGERALAVAKWPAVRAGVAAADRPRQHLSIFTGVIILSSTAALPVLQ